MHLAAILPPASERNRERTLSINVDGTINIIRAMEANAREAVLVFSSSVSTYGDTTSETPPVRVEHPQTALDIYAESKIASERLVRQAQLPDGGASHRWHCGASLARAAASVAVYR